MKWHQMTTKGRAPAFRAAALPFGKGDQRGWKRHGKAFASGPDLASRNHAGAGVNLRLGVAAGPPDGG